MARPARESLPWDEDLKPSARDGKKAKDTRHVPEPVARRAKSKVEEDEKPPIKLPKNDAELADLWWSLRKKRLAAEKVAKELEVQEKFCKAALIDRVPMSKATGIAGRLVRVAIVKKNKPRPEDWDKIYAHIRKTGDFGLLNRAINNSHVEELWDAGKKTPGIGTFPVKDLSYSEL